MAANTSPISPIAPNTGFAAAVLLTANTVLDGTGTSQLFFTAGANGASVSRIRVMHRGTNIQTVMRFFLNDGAALLAANFSLLQDQTILANTINQTTQSVPVDILLSIKMKPGMKLYYTIGTAVAAGFAVTVLDGGDY